MKIDRFPSTSLAEARVKLRELKVIRHKGRCLTSDLNRIKKMYMKEWLDLRGFVSYGYIHSIILYAPFSMLFIVH